MSWKFLSYLVQLGCVVMSYDSLNSEGYGLEVKGLYLVELVFGLKSYDKLNNEGYGLELSVLPG
jgi:hypothetical protein